MKNKELEIPLRITLYRVPPGVRFAVQKGRSDANGNAGRGPDGGPVCASLLSSTEWRPVPR